MLHLNNPLKTIFPKIFPWKGTLTLTPGMGGGGGPFRTKDHQQITKKQFVRKLITLLGHFSKNIESYL